MNLKQQIDSIVWKIADQSERLGNRHPGISEEAYPQILALFKKLCEEVIGSDEGEPEIPHNDYYWRFRNELRQQQRNNLKSKLK